MENNIKHAIDEIDVPLDKLNQAVERGVVIKKKKRGNLYLLLVPRIEALASP